MLCNCAIQHVFYYSACIPAHTLNKHVEIQFVVENNSSLLVLFSLGKSAHFIDSTVHTSGCALGQTMILTGHF